VARQGIFLATDYRETVRQQIAIETEPSRRLRRASPDAGDADAGAALIEAAGADLLATLERACGSAPPDGRIDAALAALLDWVAADPTFASALFVEALAGPAMSLERYLATISRATDLLAEVMPDEVKGRRVIVEGLACGVAAILGHLLQEGEGQGAPSLHADLLTLLTLPSGSPRPGDEGG
jgi:hypothetical protein